ncbi:MAG: zinc ribbon domain-containing protein [Thermodesulfobacteriota bacterium]
MRETEGSQNDIRQQIERLKQLQSVDIELRDIERDLQKYPKEVSVFKDEIQAISESLTEKKLQIENLDKSKSLFEKDLAEKKDFIDKTEARLLRIKTHKEYEALQKELTEAKRECLEIEENILGLMEKSETFASETENLDNSLKEKNEEYKPKIEELEKTIKDLETKHAPRREEKDSIAGGLSSEVLPVYSKISMKTPNFLALARNEMCTNCNMNIPPQMFNEVLTQTKLIQCPSCNRILYCEE